MRKFIRNILVSALTAAMTLSGSIGFAAELEEINQTEIEAVLEETFAEEEILPETEAVTETEVCEAETVLEEESEPESLEVQFLNQEPETSVAVAESEEEELETEAEEIVAEEEIIAETVPEPTVEETPKVLAEEEPVPETTEAYLIDSWAGTEQIKDLKGASSPEGSVLTWSAIPDAEGYLIGAIQNGNPYKQIDFITGGNNTKYVDKNASLTAYSYYWVFPYKKVNGKIVRGAASSNYVYGIKQLPAPQNFTATSVIGGINLGWSSVSGADGYIIKRRIGSSGSADVIADITSTSYSDKSASPTENCFYWVYAYKLSGASKRAGVTSNYAFAKAGEVKKTLSATPTTLSVYDQARIEVTSTSQGTLHFEITDSSIVSCKWEDGWNNHTTGLIITALMPGKTTIVISNTSNGETVIINVTSTKPMEKVLYANKTNVTVSDKERVEITYTGKSSIYVHSADSSIVSCKWEDGWNNYTTGLIITALKPGKTTVDVYNEENSAKITINVTSTKPAEYGTVMGNVTYHYNQYRGYVPDTKSTVILIPTDKSGNKYTGSIVTVTSSIENTYHLYSTTVDGLGNYTFDRVAEGKYAIFFISWNTTNSRPFNYNGTYDDYLKEIAGIFNDYLSPETAKNLSVYVGLNNYHLDTITVYANKTTTKSHAFPYTYN